MEGYEAVVIVDAAVTGRAAPGTVSSFDLAALRSTGGPSPHGLGLPSALAAARRFGAPVPARIELVAIEVVDTSTVDVGLTPAIEASPPAAVGAARAAVEGLRAGR